MKVFGFTEDRRVIATDLSVEEIVDKGIDPWRLDLFDAAPITKETTHGLLNFSKLGDCAFSYSLSDAWVIVGIYDGVSKLCIEGRKAQNAPTYLENIGVREEPFAWHLRRYLKLRSTDTMTKTTVLPFPSVFSKEPHRTRRPMSAKCVQLVGSRLSMAQDSFLSSGTLTGRTYEYLDLPVELAGPVQWLSNAIGGWRPQIFGEGLRKSLCGETVNRVEFLIEEGFTDAICAHLLSAYGIGDKKDPSASGTGTGLSALSRALMAGMLESPEAMIFTYQDCEFIGYASKGEEFRSWFINMNGHSVNDLQLVKPGQVRTSRIALFDAAHKQARILDPEKKTSWLTAFSTNLAPNWSKRLIADGFALVDVKAGEKSSIFEFATPGE